MTLLQNSPRPRGLAFACLLALSISTHASDALPGAATATLSAPVQVRQDADTITLQNGEIQIRVDRGDGSLKSIRQRASDDPRERSGGPHGWHDLGVNQVHAAYEAHGDDFANDPEKALYWDANADVAPVPPGYKLATKGYFRLHDGQPQVAVLTDTPDRAEVTVRSTPTPLFPFDVDWHYVLFRGQSGFYVYVELHHDNTQPAVTYYQNRFVVKTVMDGTFTHWAIGDGKFVPIPQAGIAKQVSDATFRLADGTIKTKYMNSVYWSQVPVYGYVGRHRGLWMIEASPEYHNGGPIKQGQTLHDNTMLRVMQSVHFGAAAVDIAAGEDFHKVYGPFLVYANRGSGPAALWQDAWKQYQVQRASWPYRWVASPDYVRQRGDVSGTVEIARDGDLSPAHDAWAILTPAGNDWTAQTKGYAFWQKLDDSGHFDLPHVIPGAYDLYVTGADQPRDFKHQDIVLSANERIDLGTLRWQDESRGRRLWQIGRFDRSAGEFRDGDDARNFEMYKRYPKAFPNDVDYTVGRSDASRDWNYAHWTVYRHRPDWRIHFALPAPVPATGTATLTIGFASSQPARGKDLTDLRVAVNGVEVGAIHLPKTGTAGYRGGVQDSKYNLRALTFAADLLKQGANVVSLRHADAVPIAAFEQAQKDTLIPANTTPGQVMYDALRLEIDSERR